MMSALLVSGASFIGACAGRGGGSARIGRVAKAVLLQLVHEPLQLRLRHPAYTRDDAMLC